MEVFEIEIDQLIPSQRILRKNDGAVATSTVHLTSKMLPELVYPRPRARSSTGLPLLRIFALKFWEGRWVTTR